MSERAEIPCAQCGYANPVTAKFCGGCGSVFEHGPVTDPAPSPASALNAASGVGRTMIEFRPSPEVAQALAKSEPSAERASPQDASPLAAQKTTMLGISAADLVAAPPPRATGPARDASLSAPPAFASGKQTMLGVATPGIAPVRDPDPHARPPSAGDRLPQDHRDHRTMLGVAVPGVAPTRSSDDPTRVVSAGAGLGSGGASVSPARAPAPLPPVVPAPPPLVHDEPAPAAPAVVARKRGIPIAIVAGIIAVLLLAGGGALLVFMRGGTPITAHPEVSADGKDTLRLRCDKCDDGTVADLNGARATFASHEALLPLAVPLKVGDNPVALHVRRPGAGRDETVQLAVSIGYRVRADLSTLDAPRPAITVRVEAKPGTEVQVDGKPLPLDAQGSGAYAVDIAADTDGPADKTKTITKEIPYEVTLKGAAPEKGKVSASINVLPLVLFAPGTHAVTTNDSVVVSGQAVKGSTVTVNGQTVTVGPQGVFEQQVPTASVGDVAIEIRESLASYAPRRAHVSVKRVAKLTDEAKSIEATSPAGYDATLAAVSGDASKSGQPFIADGEVEEARLSQHRTLFVMSDRRGCAKGPCLVSVVIGHEETLARGDALKVYGRIKGPVTRNDGKTVLEMDADFVIRGKR